MIPFPADLIERYRALGAWGDATIWQGFADNARANPDRLALVDDPGRSRFAQGQPRRLTYRELAASVGRLASLLHHHGLGKDDIILVQLPNFAEQIELYLAAAKLGIIVSPIPVQYRWKEISDILDTISPSAIFTTQVKAFDHAAFYLENLGDRDIPVFVFGQSSASGARTLDGDSVSPSGDIDAAEVSADEIYTICWTSGTESAPKGVPRTHNNWMTTGHGIVHGGGMKEGCCLLNPFPNVNMASIGGLFMPWLLTGGTYVLHHPFDLGVFLSQLGGEKVNYTVMAPALLNRVLADSDLLTDIDLSHLYGLGTGSAPPDAWMIEAFKSRHGVEVTNFFGSNEGVSLTAGAADVPDPEERARFFPRAGRDDFNWNNPSLNWSRTKLVDPETGAEIDAANQAGELFIRGPSVFPGYFRRGEIHTDVFDDDGYYPSGDLFEIIEDDGGPRFYHFVGRRREIIIRGGMNISPVEIDEVLSRHPALKEAACAGYPDTDLGERVCVFAVPKEGQAIDLDTVIAFLTDEGLARYKMPERLMVMETLPRNALDKVVRSDLQAALT